MFTSGSELRRAIRDDLRSAQRERDVDRVRLYRTLLAAVDNAEAVDAAQDWDYSRPSLGQTEVARRDLGGEDVRTLLQREIDERLDAADQYRQTGKPELAARLDADCLLIAAYLGG